MPNLNLTDFPINPASTSGTQLADILNRLFNAYESNQAGGTRPTQLKAGGLWTKIDGPTIRLMMYDGAVDIQIGSITGGTGVFGAVPDPLSAVYNPAVNYKQGDVIYDPTTKKYSVAKADKAPGAYNAGDWTEIPNVFNGFKAGLEAMVDAKIAAALARYLPLTGGALTGALTSTSTIHATGAISSNGDVIAFKP